eukprot:765472-Hanusia_phi.AAC.1
MEDIIFNDEIINTYKKDDTKAHIKLYNKEFTNKDNISFYSTYDMYKSYRRDNSSSRSDIPSAKSFNTYFKINVVDHINSIPEFANSFEAGKNNDIRFYLVNVEKVRKFFNNDDDNENNDDLEFMPDDQDDGSKAALLSEPMAKCTPIKPSDHQDGGSQAALLRREPMAKCTPIKSCYESDDSDDSIVYPPPKTWIITKEMRDKVVDYIKKEHQKDFGETCPSLKNCPGLIEFIDNVIVPKGGKEYYQKMQRTSKLDYMNLVKLYGVHVKHS